MDNYKKRRNWLIVGGVVALALILLISLGFLIRRNIYSANINIMVVPSTAEVKVDDATYRSFETVEVQPGEYDVEVSAEGFSTKTGKLVAKAGETTDIKLYLEPNSEQTVNWYNEHPEDALILGEIQNLEMLEKTDRLLSSEPVLNKLPQTFEYYSNDYSRYTKYVVSYAWDDSAKGFYLILKDYTSEGMDFGLNKLKEMGMDTTGVRVDYQDLSGDGLNYRAE